MITHRQSGPLTILTPITLGQNKKSSKYRIRTNRMIGECHRGPGCGVETPPRLLLLPLLCLLARKRLGAARAKVPLLLSLKGKGKGKGKYERPGKGKGKYDDAYTLNYGYAHPFDIPRYPGAEPTQPSPSTTQRVWGPASTRMSW